MKQLTKKITVNGNVRLADAMGLGSFGGGIGASVRIFNPSGSVLAYIHQMPTGTTAPAAGTEGWPIGGAAGAAGPTFEADDGSVDINRLWIHTPSSIDLIVLFTGN